MKRKVSIVCMGIASFGIGFFLGGKMLVGMINDYKKRMERNLSNMMLFNNWLDFIYEGGHIEQYFYEHSYNKIMIYGYGYIGERLIQSLKETGIKVVAIMDKSVSTDDSDIMIGVDADVPDVDCIVITPIFYHNEIRSILEKKTNKPIISIEELWKLSS